MEYLKPTDVEAPKRFSTKRLIADFIQSDLTSAEVDVERIGRTTSNVYSAIHSYLTRHPELKLGVFMSNEAIIIHKHEAGQ